jgi:hypothetical protein
MFWAITVAAAEKPAAVQATTLTGTVLEVQQTSSFTYLRMKTKDGETWAATNRAPIEKGAQVTLQNPLVMTNFESKALKRKFDKIVFGDLPGGAPTISQTGPDLAAAHAGVTAAPAVTDVKVAKATGPGARTVAEIVTKRAELKDKPVLVRGKVVKYNAAILGTNWIHLRDGTGSVADHSNDVLVTSKTEAKLGDVVLVKGVVRLDKDFGSGYNYAVMIEATELSKK